MTDAAIFQNRQAAKLWLFPHLNMAMTQRGDGLLTATARNLLERSSPDSFDDAVRLMPEVLGYAYADAVGSRKQALGIDDFPGAETIGLTLPSPAGRSPKNPHLQITGRGPGSRKPLSVPRPTVP